MDNVNAPLAPEALELHRRISARAVIAGLLVGLAFAATMMALGTAVGVTAFSNAGSPRDIGIGFAGWFLVSFAVSAFAAGWVAAGSARALRRRDGILHALVTWAAMALLTSSLVGGVMHRVAVGMLGSRSLDGEMGGRSMSQLAAGRFGAWGAFAALFIPMLAALAGGLIGASRERHVLGVSRKPRVTVNDPLGRPAAP
jgi:hypothetical protein